MNEHIVINRDRSVTVPESERKIGIQFDHNVNKIVFDCPRYADDNEAIDMSKMQVFLNYMLPDRTVGCSILENIRVDESDSSVIHFDWNVRRSHTMTNGVLSTLICIKQTDTEGNELYHWNTDLFQKFTVGAGIEFEENIVEENIDVITQLLVRMDAVDTRTSTETIQKYVDEYLTTNPPRPTNEQAATGVLAYMEGHALDDVHTYMGEHAQTCVDAYLSENPVSPTAEQMKTGVAANPELVQNSVDDYLGRNPLQLDESLSESTKAAPANIVGELKNDLVNLSKYSQNEITKVVSAVFQTEAHSFTTDFILINGVTYKMKCDFLGTIFVADDTGHSHNTVVNEVFEFTPSKTGNLAIWYPNSVIGSEVNVTVYGKYSETTDEKIKKLDDLTDVLFQNTTLAEFINGGYFDSAGNFIQNDGFVYTDYIDVNDGKTVRGRLRQFSKNLSMVVFYDTDKNMVSFYTGDGSTESKQISFNLAIPKTVKYVRFSSHRVDENDEYEYAYVSNVDNDTKIFVSEEIEKLEVSNELKNIPCPNQGYILPNGKISTEGFNWSGYIPIEKGSRIYGKGLGVGGNLCIYYFYDSELNPISGYKGTPVDGVYVLEEYDVFAPDGASYVAFTTHNANEKFKEVNANIEWTLKQYVTHEIDIFKKENELATKYYVGYGKTDNVKYFQKLTDCLWKVSKTDGKKEIYIHDGIYDVLAELGGMDYILSKNTTNNTYREVHPFVYDTKIIGVGHVVLNFLLDDGTPHENYWLFSCLGISGNCYIENIEIHSKNCRYSIHDESGNLYPDTERHYKNVRCYQNETSGVGGQAVGCGFSERTRVTLENCYFGARSESWSCHANDGCSFVFKDTVFDSYENLTHSLRISQNGTADLYVTISNCFIDKGLSIRDEGQNPVVMDTTRVDLINTKVPNLVNGYTVITQPVTSYNTIDGTKSVMLATN